MRNTLHVARGRRTNGPDRRQPVGPTLPTLLTPAEVAAWLKTTISAVYAKAELSRLIESMEAG